MTVRDLVRACGIAHRLLLAWAVAQAIFWTAAAFAALALILLVGGCAGRIASSGAAGP